MPHLANCCSVMSGTVLTDDGDAWRVLKTEMSWLICFSIRSMRSWVSDDTAAGAAAADVAGEEIAAEEVGSITTGEAVVIAGAEVVTAGGTPLVAMMIQFKGVG